MEQIDKYASEEMRDALKRLGEWDKKEGKELEEDELSIKAEELKRKLDAGDKKADQIDLARRRVSFYFSSILQLKRHNYGNKHFLQGYDIRGTRRMLDIVLSLHKQKDTTQDKAGYRTLERDFAELVDWLDVRKEGLPNE